tara:strand:+ start:402 stop:587 length:186 start_codon:yes stop_codon:yes gene_type:complete
MTIRYPVSIAINPGNIAKPWSTVLVFGQNTKRKASKHIGIVIIERKVAPKIPHASGPIHSP